MQSAKLRASGGASQIGAHMGQALQITASESSAGSPRTYNGQGTRVSRPSLILLALQISYYSFPDTRNI